MTRYLDRDNIPLGSSARLMRSYTNLMNLISEGDFFGDFDMGGIKNAMFEYKATRFCSQDSQSIDLFDKQLNDTMAKLPNLTEIVEYKLIN